MIKSYEKNLRILITDGHDPAALGVMRAFGRAGHQLIAAHVAENPPPLCLSSRYCGDGCIQPDARKGQAEFRSWLADRVQEGGLDAVVPISAAAISACAGFGRDSPAPFFLAATDNGAGLSYDMPGLFARATNSAIRTPRTWMPSVDGGWSEHGTDIVLDGESLRFPVVLRAGSRIDSADPYCPGYAYYCGGPGELAYLRDAFPGLDRTLVLQQYLPGESEFALLLRLRGQVRMQWAYRAVHGVPHRGRRAALFERVNDAGLLEDAAKLLGACDFEGLASLEFRGGEGGHRYLVGMDRSPWIGAVVALRAGFDFPCAWLDLLQDAPAGKLERRHRKGADRSVASSGQADDADALPPGGHRVRQIPPMARLHDVRGPLIKGRVFCWSDPAPSLSLAAEHVKTETKRVLTSLFLRPGSHRFLAQAAGLAERMDSQLALAVARRKAQGRSRQLGNHGGAPANRPKSAFPLRIFMFHAVIGQPLEVPHYCFVNRNLFRNQLELIKRFYRVLPLSMAVRSLSAGELSEPSAVITFDDGFENNFTEAFPELQRLELPASIFVATGFTDSEGTPWFCRLLRAIADTRERALDWNGRRFDLAGPRAKNRAAAELMVQVKRQPPGALEADLGCIESLLGFEPSGSVEPGSPFRMLNSEAIRTMAASGLVEFGGHTVTHSILSNLTADGQRREIQQSLNSLGRILGEPCRLFAYPNGQSNDFDDRSIECLRDSGVTIALTAMPGVNRCFDAPFGLRREAVGPPDLAPRFEARLGRMVGIDHLHAGRVP